MDSMDPKAFPEEDEGEVLQGEYHGHPYGELNLVVSRRRLVRRRTGPTRRSSGCQDP
jgi:hypothetical protein